MRNEKSRLLRWSLSLQRYEFELEHLKGKENMSDILSRAFSCNAVSAHVRNRSLVVPVREDIPLILEQYHLATGNGGISTMKHHILSRYCWKGANSAINKYVFHCLICQQNALTKKHISCHAFKTVDINELWEMDMVGPIPDCEYQNRRLLNIIDVFSKLAFSAVVKNKSSETVIKVITAVVARWGKPKSCLTDNGLVFSNIKLKSFCDQHGIVLKHGSPYKPSTQGCIARFNQSMSSKLRKLAPPGKSWTHYVSKAIDSYNNSFSRAIGATPNELHGSTFTVPIDSKYLKASALIPNAPILLAKARAAKRKYIDEYDTPGHISNLVVGDRVLYAEPGMHRNKLFPRWPTFGTIVEKFFDSFKIMTDDGKYLTTSKDHIKLLKSTQLSLPIRGGSVGTI